MPQGSNIIAFFMMVFGKTLGSDQQFMDRLKNRVQLREVHLEDESDVIIAFVAIVTRAGTDIEAALDRLPTNRPVILVVLHHTFEENYTAPNSRRFVKSDNVLAVDCLYHEDHGLMRCLRNDEALKVATDRLIDLGGTPSSLHLPINQQTSPRCYACKWLVIFIVVISLLILTVLLIYFLIISPPKGHNVTGHL